MKLYGLIGYPLSHSFSKKFFDEKFIKEKILDCEFVNFSIENISLLPTILSKKNLRGLAVTIPYKRDILSYLNQSSSDVQSMKACNCVKVADGKLTGYNTDIIGFEKSFTPHLQPHHKKALILGTGGASSAVAFVLQKLNISYRFVSRTKTENRLLYIELYEQLINEYTIIINTSPLGTYPNVNEFPNLPYQYLSNQHYLFDLVYNPTETKFLYLGKQQNAIIQNGYAMLVFQAEENWKIWNS